MELDYRAYKTHETALKTLVPNFNMDVVPGDNINFTYDFSISYFGDVVEKLEAVGEICSDPAVVVAAECAILEKGRCLAYEILQKLDSVIKEVQNRGND
jgi:hypothetical protein